MRKARLKAATVASHSRGCEIGEPLCMAMSPPGASPRLADCKNSSEISAAAGPTGSVESTRITSKRSLVSREESNAVVDPELGAWVAVGAAADLGQEPQ